MPESHTKCVNNSDITRRRDANKRRGMPCFREYSIIAVMLFVWARMRYGRNDYIENYIMTHFRKVLDDIERLHESIGTGDEAVHAAGELFTAELQLIAENIKWIYE